MGANSGDSPSSSEHRSRGAAKRLSTDSDPTLGSEWPEWMKPLPRDS
jgi:hypothetical protein